MASFNVAKFENNDLSFVVMEVPDHVLNDQGLIDAVVAGGVCEFYMPVVLVGVKERNAYGRPEILDFLHYVDVNRLPWSEANVRV
jgi:hypothetical protein